MPPDFAELAKNEGGYQTIEINDKEVWAGWRDCKQRWDLINPFIKSHQTIIDVGSHYGYFAYKAARKDKSNLVWSIEPNEGRAEIQRLMLEANNMTNVVLSNKEVSLVDLLHLQRTCEHADTIICLSTIHYFPPEQIPEILWAFSQLAPNLIIEFPSPDELDVAEKEVVDQLDPLHLLGQIYDSVQEIGQTSSPKHKDVKRPMYIAQNFRITRRGCSSYWHAKTGGNHVVEYDKARWSIDGKSPLYNGLNLANLREYNVAYPNQNKWLDEAADRYIELIKNEDGRVTDIHPRNLIVTAEGVFPIDYSEYAGSTIYGLQWDEYHERVKSIDHDDVRKWLEHAQSTGTIKALFNE